MEQSLESQMEKPRDLPLASDHHRDWTKVDREHNLHPYAHMTDTAPLYPVVAAEGVRLTLADGRQLVDGMSSWWAAIHGYNHPALNAAAHDQIERMAHIMFGGIAHEPAAQLTHTLLQIVPGELRHFFYCDSGSVSVEVAIKMAVQYWVSLGRRKKTRLLTIRGGYHGDTFAAMSVCDPVTGMHQLFEGVLPQHLFADAPATPFQGPWIETDILPLEQLLVEHSTEIAAVIMEPIVQGAGGMRFYSPEYLKHVRHLCDQYDVLLILDEIATGFGRTGKMFASEHAGIAADIMCIGKALTGGYISLAATICNDRVRSGIASADEASGGGVFMHGPTFMANPLACAIAKASVELLLHSPWQARVEAIEQQLREQLTPCLDLPGVHDVRVLGAIGVVEMDTPVNMAGLQAQFVESGAWIRPFGKLIYLMPPFVIDTADLTVLTNAIVGALKSSEGSG